MEVPIKDSGFEQAQKNIEGILQHSVLMKMAYKQVNERLNGRKGNKASPETHKKWYS